MSSQQYVSCCRQVPGWFQPAAASPWRLEEKFTASLVSEPNTRIQGDPGYDQHSVILYVKSHSDSLKRLIHIVIQLIGMMNSSRM